MQLNQRIWLSLGDYYLCPVSQAFSLCCISHDSVDSYDWKGSRSVSIRSTTDGLQV